MAERPWWSAWWAVALWFIVACLAVLPVAFAWGLWALLDVETVSGTDMLAPEGAADWTRVLAGVGVLLVAAVPFLTARWARKAWLGYLILAWIAQFVLLMVGLAFFGLV